MDDLKSLFERATRMHFNARTLPGCPSIANRKIISGLLDSAERLGCLSRDDLIKRGVDYVLREDEILDLGEDFTKAAAIEVSYHLKAAVGRAYAKDMSLIRKLVFGVVGI